MNAWGLPRVAVIGGVEYSINADFRDVLEVIGYLSDPTKMDHVKWEIAVSLFYDGDIPDEHKQEAMEYLADFISYGATDDKPGAKLIDWNQDAKLIIGDINKVAGKEIRAESFLHWWTFLSYFYGIGEGQLSTVVSIRSKKKKGKKLDKWEQEYYQENKQIIDFQTPDTPEAEEMKEYFDMWL